MPIKNRLRQILAEESVTAAPVKKAGSDYQSELKWAADQLDRANDLMLEVVETLDARPSGEPSLSDVFGSAALASRILRMNVSKEVGQASESLRRQSQKYPG